MKLADTLLLMLGQFALMSLFAIGGANSVLPEMHRFVVEQQGWITHQKFAELFGLAQGVPGPNMLVVALIGYHVAGIPGALVCTIGLIGPSSVLTYFVYRVWDRFKGSAWRELIQSAAAPVTVGLVLASGYIIARGAAASWVAVGLTAAVAVLTATTRAHPLIWLAIAAAMGALGLV
ncbi:MAG: chromate transporter [Alphaproteobacteria bacterium]|nr:chromate transporter [Alphaproteobacteria bacterium]MCW5743687.1 chromate transporter [Alphaproteobacteria bacterium]